MRAGEPGGRGRRGGGRKPVFPFFPMFVVRSFSGVGSCRCSNSAKMRVRKNLGFMWGHCAISGLRENSS